MLVYKVEIFNKNHTDFMLNIYICRIENQRFSMKHTLFHTVLLLQLIFLTSCDTKEIIASRITFRGIPMFSSIMKDTVIFTAENIKWLNGSTGELSFSDSAAVPKVNACLKLTCYVGADSLFTFRVTSDIMSSIVNDLVLNHNLQDGKYYFADGYPAHLSSIETNTLRLLNYQKREAAWAKFITQLKLSGKYKE